MNQPSRFKRILWRLEKGPWILLAVSIVIHGASVGFHVMNGLAEDWAVLAIGLIFHLVVLMA